MTIKVNGIEIGTITTNRSLTIEEAMKSLGYDISNQDDCGNYCFDTEATEMKD